MQYYVVTMGGMIKKFPCDIGTNNVKIVLQMTIWQFFIQKFPIREDHTFDNKILKEKYNLERWRTISHVSRAAVWASSWNVCGLATHVATPRHRSSFPAFVIAFRLTRKESQRPEVRKNAHAVTRGRWQRRRRGGAQETSPWRPRRGVDALVRTSPGFSGALKRARASATPRN